jgi:hypothetical protein
MMRLPHDWKDWDGEQRARCLLHLALSTLPPGQVFVSGPEVNARALGLSEPEMREWVALVAPLLAGPAPPPAAAPPVLAGLGCLRKPEPGNRADATVEVVGPGLVVNGPALAMLEGLRAAGYQVDAKAWCGLDQWEGTAEELWAHIQKHAPGMLVRVDVRPTPWGG